MRALVLEAEGQLPKLQEVPVPRPARGEVLVKVAAAGVNYADTMMRRGFYLQKPEFPFIPGFEFSGVVAETGEGVAKLKVGDRVMGTAHATYAEYVAAPAGPLMKVPEAFSDEEAAAFPVIYITSYAILRLSGHAKAGETVLVHAAGGGVGTATIQLARHLGLRVIATASSDEKLEIARRLGAELTINYKQTDFVRPVLEATGGRGADIICESIGGDFLARDIEAAAPFGRIVVFGMASGQPFQFDIGNMFRHSVSIAVLWMFTLSQEPELAARTTAELLEIVQKAGIRPVLGTVYPLEKAGEALVALESRKTHGKLVLKP